MTPDPSIKPPIAKDRNSFLENLQKSGIVGLGGAGFPTYAKYLLAKEGEVEELIVNGAECEPYITSDTLMMKEHSSDLLFGISSVCDALNIKKAIVAIEKDNKTAKKAILDLPNKDGRIEIKYLPNIYPEGSEKILVYNTTGKIITRGKLPHYVKSLVSNSSTLCEIGRYLRTGMPLVRRLVTMSGNALVNSGNFIIPIGTSVADAFEFAGGFSESPYKIIMGGPMTGITLDSLTYPIVKYTNALLALSSSEIVNKRETACIHCSRCAEHCPHNLDPRAFMVAYKSENDEELERLAVDLCMDCGVCSYVCPARKPLAEFNKLSKRRLASYRAAIKERK